MQRNILSVLNEKKEDLVQTLFQIKQLYNNVFPMLNEERRKLAQKISDRQDNLQTTVLNNQEVIRAFLFGLVLSSLLLVAVLLLSNELKDHPQCGVITDGKVSDAIK